jgi:hypothetical protein
VASLPLRTKKTKRVTQGEDPKNLRRSTGFSHSVLGPTPETIRLVYHCIEKLVKRILGQSLRFSSLPSPMPIFRRNSGTCPGCILLDPGQRFGLVPAIDFAIGFNNAKTFWDSC